MIRNPQWKNTGSKYLIVLYRTVVKSQFLHTPQSILNQV